MLFPESERVVFTNNPIVQVICQLRFPPILDIASKEPADFQNAVRGRYPLYEKAYALPQEVTALLTSLPLLPLPEGVTHKFYVEDKTCEIALARDYVAVAATKYTRWEHFSDEVLLAREALEKVYSPAFYSRIGLRYRDVIDKSALRLAEAPWSSLIRTSILGLLAEEQIISDVIASQSQSLIRLDDQGGFMILQHSLTLTAGGGQTYAIDADFYTERRGTREDVPNILRRFNRIAGNFFRWSITPRLRDALGPNPVQ